MAGHEDSDQLRIEALQEINADLLAALEDLLADFKVRLTGKYKPEEVAGFPEVQAARAAIRKAKGESA